MSTRQVVAIGLIMGLTAAAVVWWLERFESERLHGEVRSYLDRYDEFRDWLASQGGEQP